MDLKDSSAQCSPVYLGVCVGVCVYAHAYMCMHIHINKDVILFSYCCYKNYHKLRVLKHPIVTILEFWMSEVWNDKEVSMG